MASEKIITYADGMKLKFVGDYEFGDCPAGYADCPGRTKSRDNACGKTKRACALKHPPAQSPASLTGTEESK